MRREHLYQGIIIFLLIFIVWFVCASSRTYKGLLEVCDEQAEIIDNQRESYEKIIDNWRESYEELNYKYAELLTEDK